MNKVQEGYQRMTCTCGNDKAHRVASRRTSDGVTVELWNDGAVTGRMGFALPGVPVARPSAAKLPEAMSAGWLLLGEAEVYEASELGDLYEACRWAAARQLGPGAVRARLVSPIELAPVWETYSADRNGRPTVRVWRLPRLRWPGLAVWDHVSVGASGGRYEVMAIDRTGVATRIGIRFATLRELSAHLLAEGR